MSPLWRSLALLGMTTTWCGFVLGYEIVYSIVMKNLCILGIETSCDETAVAIYQAKKGLLAHILHSQEALHAEYGGVVPELASRDHIKKLAPIVQKTLEKAGLDWSDINGIAYTQGPGLVGALMVGAVFARSLGYALNIPTIGVHHLEGHLLAPMLEKNRPDFPFVALIVSGGHTLLMRVDGLGQYHLLGESLDDAAGEALDKTAKLLGLSYPGGAKLEKLAQNSQNDRFKFPRPMIKNSKDLNFSFSGLKTLAVNTLHNFGTEHQTKIDLAYSFQEAVMDTLVIKSFRALKKTNLKKLVVAGGVSANKKLREKMSHMAQSIDAELFYPRFEFCTDNAAMIAYTGFLRFQAGHADKDLEIHVYPRWEFVNN